jgi:NAD-dependent DNA ligase
MTSPTQQDALISLLRKYDRAYNRGAPLVTDEYYDAAREKARALYPKNKYFYEDGEVDKEDKPLPAHMPSLSKLRPDSVMAWATKVSAEDRVVVSDKLDGISCLLHYRDGRLVNAYKKGSETTGRSILRHIKHVCNVPAKLTRTATIQMNDVAGVSIDSGDFIVRGELVMAFDKFRKHAYSASRPKGYKHPRSMVASLFLQDSPNPELLQDVNFLACELLFPKQASQARALTVLASLSGFELVYNLDYDTNELDPSAMEACVNEAKASKYPCDGVVVSACTGSGINSIAVKLHTADQTAVRTTVKGVEIEMSVRNLAKPTILIEPVTVDGVTISRLTGNNMREIDAYKIGKGSKVYVVRAGDVIPHMLKTGKYAPTPSPDYKPLRTCPDCGSKLDWTLTSRGKAGADLKCFDDYCLDGKQTATFLGRLGVKGIGSKHIQTLAQDRSVADVLALAKKDLCAEIGEGIGSTVYTRLHDAMASAIVKIMYASGIFATGSMSLGETTLDKIMKALNAAGYSDLQIVDLPHKGVEGVNEAQMLAVLPPIESTFLFTSALGRFRIFYDTIARYHKAPVKSDELAGMRFCFSGFRDPALVEAIRSKNGVYSDSLTKDTDYLVCMSEPHATKKDKAKKYGCQIIQATELHRMLGDVNYAPEEARFKPSVKTQAIKTHGKPAIRKPNVTLFK